MTPDARRNSSSPAMLIWRHFGHAAEHPKRLRRYDLTGTLKRKIYRQYVNWEILSDWLDDRYELALEIRKISDLMQTTKQTCPSLTPGIWAKMGKQGSTGEANRILDFSQKNSSYNAAMLQSWATTLISWCGQSCQKQEDSQAAVPIKSSKESEQLAWRTIWCPRLLTELQPVIHFSCDSGLSAKPCRIRKDVRATSVCLRFVQDMCLTFNWIHKVRPWRDTGTTLHTSWKLNFSKNVEELLGETCGWHYCITFFMAAWLEESLSSRSSPVFSMKSEILRYPRQDDHRHFGYPNHIWLAQEIKFQKFWKCWSANNL